ncbi:MAG: ribonuclease catalytic domain-containing protein [Desulfobulbaceae bacterium]|nr:ribonuclease catalytic domain-containing protein [Desulfobulbaceae bacterium]HIJ78103.1 RNB domain-containing ribonuclease [Deltaproteobacteria bacterium]
MSLQGKIIEYIEQGRFICAMVVEDGAKRLRLVNQNDREVNLPVARLVHQTKVSYPAKLGRNEMIKLLKETDQRRTLMMQEISLEEIWQVVVEEQGQSFTPQFLAGLSFGDDAEDDQVAAFLRIIFVDRLYFKYKEGLVVAHSAEVVEQLKAKQQKEKQHQALLDQGVENLRRMQDGKEPGDWPERELCLAMIRDYYLFGNEAEESGLGRELLKKAGLHRPHDVYHLLVKAGIWHKDENVALLRYDLPVEFGEALCQEAAVAEPSAAELLAAKRKDFRALPLLTIDGSATRDFDDALHIEKRGDNFLVGIHISDVAYYVKPDSALYLEASKRMTSIYFPERQIPMLPPQLSEGVCSLIAGKARPAMSFMVLLSPRGEVLEYEIVSSVVEVKRQLSYDESDQMAGDDPELRDLAKLADQLLRRRLEAGALILPIPDVNVRLGQDNAVSLVLAPVDTLSRSLVQEFMVLANTLAAEYVADRQAPGLFRAQAAPHQRFIQGIDKDLFTIFRQRKQLKPGELLTYPKPHSGVGATQYTTVTSPIRRFWDLVMQHQIGTLLLCRGPLFNEDAMQGVIGLMSTVMPKVNQVRRWRQRYWLLKYLEPKLGNRLRALMVNKGPRRVNLVLEDCLLDVDMPPSQGINARPGDMVSIKLAKVDALDNVLNFEW